MRSPLEKIVTTLFAALAVSSAGCGETTQAVAPAPYYGVPARAPTPFLDTVGPVASPTEVQEAKRAALVEDVTAIVNGDAVGGGGADINQRPIRIWFVEQNGGVDDVYVLGHADGECCPIVSGALSSAERNPAIQGAWFSYGVGLFHAGGDAARRAVLSQLVSSLGEIAKKSECEGQVTLTRLGADRIAQASASMQLVAADVLGRAQALNRPIMLWHHLDDGLPRIVPATVLDEAGHPVPLQMRMALSDFAIPDDLVKGLTLDGTASYIAEIRARMSALERLARVQAEARKLAGGVNLDLQKRLLETNSRAKAEPIVRAALARIDAYIVKWRAVAEIHAIVGLADGHPDSALADLGEARRLCVAALEQVAALPYAPISDEDTRIVYADAIPTESANPYEFVVRYDVAGEQARLSSRLGELLKQPVVPPSNPTPLLIDAFLRGWPVSFNDDAQARRYDAWVGANQQRVWEQICRGLAGRGVRLGSCARGEAHAVQLSNVMFQVAVGGGVVLLQPSFVLGGPVVQVADPAARMVRYESAIADQNLVHFEPRTAER
jgi:hypothetical protein